MPKTFMMALLLAVARMNDAAEPVLPADVAAFNQELGRAIRALDDAALLALWDTQGVSLLPQSPPLLGKSAIARNLQEVMTSLPGAQMETFELHCHALAVESRLASEWCEEHQLIRFDNHRKHFEGRGKILLLLRRDAQGPWRILSEMWNQGGTDSGGTDSVG